MIEVYVPLGERSYVVHIGKGARELLTDVLPSTAKKVAIVAPASLELVIDAFDVEHKVFTLPDGDEGKKLEVVGDLCSQFSDWGLTRSDVVVGFGGGATTDIAGFAASIYHRGLPVIFVPTTLLAMVDAAIGGKNGANLPEGKNLIGTFWQPLAVLSDLEFLRALPEREYNSGMAEIAKCALVTRQQLRDFPIEEMIGAAVQWKVDIVGADERESGQRAILNYGHTLGHALEIEGKHDLRHGEAVAIGLAFALRLATELGRIDQASCDQQIAEIKEYGLSVEMPKGVDVDGLITLMTRDKKAVDEAEGSLTFVLDGASGVEVVKGVAVETARKVLKEMS